MADVNANIGVNIDTSNALAQLKALQRQISQFHTSIAKSSETAALAQRDLQRNFINGVNAIGAFSAELRTIKTTAESFTDSLEKNKFSMREYFRFAGASTRTFGRLFKSEFDTINKVAEENVKRLQTQYIKMGRDATGAMRAIAIMPNQLDMSQMSTQLQMAAQRQALFNQLVKQGSTNLLNFGKNTQWAGRQLMVGFTLPLATLGTVASRTFMDMETAALKFRKVYGDLFTPAAEREQALADIQALGQSFTQYGIAVSQTVNLAADAAAAGFQGLDLQRQVTEATRLQVLGQIEQQKALETTISLQNAFRLSNEDLTDSINFLNAVENQTVVSLDDITTAIPKVAPVIMQLGGNVKDLAFFMTAMKQGGVNASEGANALKSGLAALINPTEKAADMLANMGINIREIVESNQGNLRATVIEFAKALDTLDPLTRARAIEQLFGKFQFARLSTLFENVTAGGTQAARVLDIAGYSASELAATAESELGQTAQSSMNKFRKAVEDLRLALVPVGQSFLEAITPIAEFIGNLLEKFNNLSSGTKKAITLITVAIGAIGPVALMTFGLIANGAANLIKGFMVLRNGYLRLTGQSQILSEQTEFLTVEQQKALAVASSLDQSHARLTQTFNAEAGAVRALANEYRSALNALQNFASRNPGMMLPQKPRGYAKGGEVVVVPGSGNQDTVPAMLTPGEIVIPKRQSKKYGPLIAGIVADNIPGFRRGGKVGIGTAVDIPGGMAAAHYGTSPQYQTGAELLKLVENLDTAFANKIRKMVADVEGGLDRVFTVFTNEVVATSTELNRAIGETGTGKKAPIAMAKSDLIDKGNVRDIELQRQLTNAGVSIDDFREINKKVTQEISNGFDKLGDVSTVTAEDVNKLVSDAYEEIAKTDDRVRAALDKMKQLSTVTDPRTDSRIALSQDPYFKARASGKYRKGMEQVAGPGNVPYSANARFLISNQMAESIGLSSADAARVYKQFSDEVKIKLASLRGDIAAFTTEFEAQAEKAGLKTGNAYKVGIEKSGLKDIYVESRQRTSPHPMASKDGTDDGIAYEKAREGAVTRTRRTARTGVITPGTNFPVEKSGGVPLQQVASAAIISEATKNSAETMVKASKSFQDRITGLNRGLMSGTFALGSLAGLASFSGGKLGEFAGVVSKLNLAMFALMSVTQLLTQTQFTKLAADRLGLAQAAIANAHAAGAAKISGKAGLLGSFSRLFIGITRFLGPIGLATTALLGTAAVIKMVNAARERERLAIEGLGDAALLTKQKLETLGEFFGVKPQTTPLERTGPQLVVNQETRTQLDELRQNAGFLKEFANDIKSLRNATAEQAELIFNSLAVQLKGKGFAKEQIDLILKALQEESGKTNLNLSFANIDLATEQGQAELKQSVKSLGESLGKDFATGYTSQTNSAVSYATGEVVTWTEETLSKNLKKTLSTTSKALAGMLNGISGQLANGTITAEQFNESFGTISQTIKDMPQPQAALVLNAVLKNLDGELAKTAIGLKSTSDQLLLVEAAMLGVTTITPVMIAALKLAETSLDGGTQRAATRIRAKIKSDIKDLKEIREIVAKELGTKTGGGDGEKSAFQKAIDSLKEQRTQLVQSQEAYARLKKAGVETARAFEIASDPILAAAIATTKVGSKQWKELLKLIKDVNTELLDSELLKFFEGRTDELNLKKQFAEIVPLLEKLGLDAKDIQAILSNPDLAREFIKDLKDGVINSKELARYIAEIPELKKIDIVLGITTEEDAFAALKSKADELFGFLERAAEREFKPLILQKEKEVKNAEEAVDAVQAKISKLEADVERDQRTVEITLSRKIEEYQEQVNDLQRNIEEQFTRPIEDLNEQINKIERTIKQKFDEPIAGLQADIEAMQRSIEFGFERPIAALQEESSDLANELELMDRAAEQINEKYDAQEAALQKIADVNQEISAQQKQQLSIADALTQGDISAAAQAAQEARSQAAAAASQRASGTLDAARQAQLEGLRTRQGMTRVQVEQRQFAISQEVFSLEEQKEEVAAKILIKQDQIYALEQARIPFQDQIKVKQEQIYLLQEQQKTTTDEIRRIEDLIYQLEEQREEKLIAIQLIEDQIYNIKNGINVKDEENLVLANKKLEDAKKNLEVVKQELQDRIDNIEAQKDAWQAAADAQIAAKIAAGEYNDVLKATEDYLKRILLLQKQIADAARSATIGGATTAASGTPKIVTAPIVKGDKKDDSKKDDSKKDDSKKDDSKKDDNTEKIDENTKKITDQIETLTELRKETESGTGINVLLKEHIDELNDTLLYNKPSDFVDEQTKLAEKRLLERDPVSNDWLEGYSSFLKKEHETFISSITQSYVDEQSKFREQQNEFLDSVVVKVGEVFQPIDSGTIGMFGDLGYESRGGFIKPKYMAVGGLARGSDKIPSMLTPGEFVMNKYAVQEYGLEKMKAINNGEYNGESVYNYSVNVNVKSGSNPEEIARAVMTQIKQIDSQRIRGQRVS